MALSEAATHRRYPDVPSRSQAAFRCVPRDVSVFAGATPDPLRPSLRSGHLPLMGRKWTAW